MFSGVPRSPELIGTKASPPVMFPTAQSTIATSEGEEGTNERPKDRRTARTDGDDFRPPSPGLLSGSSGNVGGSPGTRPAPDRWPSQRAASESPPEAETKQTLVRISCVIIKILKVLNIKGSLVLT